MVNKNSCEHKVLGKVFIRENLSCISNIETPYYFCEVLNKICIYCVASSFFLADDDIHYPQ